MIFPPYRFGEFLLGMVLARAVGRGARLARPGLCALGATGELALVMWRLTTFTGHTGTAVARPFAALLTLPLLGLLLLAAATSDLDGRRT